MIAELAHAAIASMALAVIARELCKRGELGIRLHQHPSGWELNSDGTAARLTP